VISQILHSLHLVGWLGLALQASSPVLAIGGYLMFSNGLFSRLTIAAAGLLLITLAFVFIGAGAVMVRVG
jgi:hypothetical protein